MSKLVKSNNQNRLSMPAEILQTSSSIDLKKNEDNEEVFTSVQKKNPRKKAQAVSSVHRPNKQKKSENQS